MQLTNKLTKLFIGKSKGVGFIEVLIALALLGIVAAAFLNGLSTSLNAVVISDEGSTALALAQGQMEYVKSQDYSPEPSDHTWSYMVVTFSDPSSSNPPSWWDPDNANPPRLSSDYAGYCAKVEAEDFDADEDGNIDEDIRRITITVYHNESCTGDVVFILEDYKVNR